LGIYRHVGAADPGLGHRDISNRRLRSPERMNEVVAEAHVRP
jgi:hypothetical protein